MRIALATVLGLIGVFFVVVGLFFADWSGNHQISWSGVITGVAFLAGAVAAMRFRRRRAVPAEPK